MRTILSSYRFGKRGGTGLVVKNLIYWILVIAIVAIIAYLINEIIKKLLVLY